MTTMAKEAAEGDITADQWISAILKISCILLLGVVIIGGICTGANITASSPFYGMYGNVISQFGSGYSLAALMVLVISAVSILHFLGFM